MVIADDRSNLRQRDMVILLMAEVIWLVCPSMFHDWIAVAGLIGGGCDLGGPLV